MVTDTENHLSFDDQASGLVTEELSGFASGSQTEDNTEQLLNVGDTMSDIGRVVSQAEAGMAFSANLDAPMEGVRKLARPVPAGRARAVPADDMSMSRLADSYWKVQNTSGLSEFEPADLQSMEFSTHSASNNELPGATAEDAATQGSHVSLGKLSAGEAASRIAAHRRLGSFHSDSWRQQNGMSLPRRPESYHAVHSDGPSMFDGPSNSDQQRAAPRPPSVPGNAPGERFARLAARYFSPQSDSARAAVENDYQARASSDGMSDTPDIHTAFTSGQLSMTEPSPSPPPRLQQPAQSVRQPLPSIVERTHTALQMHFASADNTTDMQRPGLHGARAQSQPSIATGGRYGGSGTRYSDEISHTGSGYPHVLPTFSMESRSIESLDHPNLGSQGTASRDNSMGSMEDSRPFGHGGASDDDDQFGAHRINSFGNSPTTASTGQFGTRGGRRLGDGGAAEFEDLASVANADELFGDGYSSNPGLSDIERDHEQVFRDLFDSSDDEDGRAIGLSDEFDPSRPPASLFASSTSIVAEIERRKEQDVRPHRAFASWDGREATAETLRRQELQYSGSNNPIDMLNKSNSLGIPEQDVSGLLPESEFSPPGLATAGRLPAKHSVLGRIQSGLPTPHTAAEGGRYALYSPAISREAPPPTTPTTLISRDRHHRPLSRVLHRVPPFDPTSSRTSAAHEQSAESLGPDDGHSAGRRPAGPRPPGARPPMLRIPQQASQRNARAAAEFAQATWAGSTAATTVAAPMPAEPPSVVSSHGLGSLFQDSLPNLDASRVSRTPNTPLRLLSRSGHPSPFHSREWPLNQSGSSRATSNANYVPFQDPTVDVSQLARYNAVDVGEGAAPRQAQQAQQQQYAPGRAWSMRKQHAGVSADRMDSPAQQRRLLLVSDREIHSRQDDDSDDMAATVRLDSPTPPATTAGRGRKGQAEGPTLADIYALLKQTVSSLDSQRVADAPQPDYGLPYELRADAAVYASPDQSFASVRPSAPTPRRSRMFPRVADDAAGAAEPPVHAAALRRAQTTSQLGHRPHDTAEPIHARFQQHLQRHTSDSLVGSHGAAGARHRSPPYGSRDAWGRDSRGRGAVDQEISAAGDAGAPDMEALASLLRAAGIRDEDMQGIPQPLAEKLMELTASLARGQQKTGATRGVDSAVQTTDMWREGASGRGGAQEGMLRLQEGILAKLDEYREEVDMLRTEVRQGSSVATPPGSHPAHRAGTNGSIVMPHDSVSFAAARGRADGERAISAESDDGRCFLTPSPRPASEPRPLLAVPTTAKNRQRHMVQWLTQHDGSPVPHSSTGGSSGGPGRRNRDAPALATPTRRDRSRYGATAEDAEEDAPDYYQDRKGVDAGIDDGALSDASTTVPEHPPRMRMRSPIDPAMVNPANVPSRRQLQSGRRVAHRAKADALGSSSDLLQARETLEAVRRRRQEKDGSADCGGGEEDEVERLVYSKRMTQQLAQTLAELQRVHLSYFHGPDAPGDGCLVCTALEAQNHDPYLYGRHAVAYKSMSTRELQSVLNAYVAAMEDELGPRAAKALAAKGSPRRRGGDNDALGYTRQDHRPAHHSFTPTRGRGASGGQPSSGQSTPKLGAKDAQATRMVIGLLHEELAALSRRYHRMVDEYHRLDPSHADDQRRRRQMARELKDLVDLLDVKGEQIAVLAALHPSLQEDARRPRAAGEPAHGSPVRTPGSIERAFQSAKALQQALGDLY